MTREELKKIALCYAHNELKDSQSPIEDVVAAAFIDGAHYADQHPHWISVEDELPPKQPNREQSKNVLVRTNSGRTKIEYYDYGNDVIKEWWEHNITHWMPLPQAPHHIAEVSKKIKKGGKE